MHEAGLVADAVGAALRAGPPDGAPGAFARPRGVRVTVTDPVHVSADAVRLYAEVVLRAQDLADVPLEIVSVEVACSACGAPNRPEPRHPFCGACGWPLPRAAGPEVEVHATW
jgi:Zn finger protein HypA/HybF involved in hydrogenase expression